MALDISWAQESAPFTHWCFKISDIGMGSCKVFCLLGPGFMGLLLWMLWWLCGVLPDLRFSSKWCFNCSTGSRWGSFWWSLWHKICLVKLGFRMYFLWKCRVYFQAGHTFCVKNQSSILLFDPENQGLGRFSHTFLASEWSEANSHIGNLLTLKA